MIKRQKPEELKELALDIHCNRVFTDRHIPENQKVSMIPAIFMPVLLVDKKQRNDILKNSGMFYEYYDRAGPRGVNGFPCFASMRCLHKEDLWPLWEMVKKMDEAVEAVKKET